MQMTTAMFFPFVIYLVIRRINERKLTSLELLVILLFFSSLLSIYLSPNPSLAAKNIIYHSILLVIIPIGYAAKYDEIINIHLASKLISAVALLSAALGIIRYFSRAERAYGFFGGYYTLASTLAFTIPITFVFIFYSKYVWKYLAIVSTFIQTAALWLTFTRSALMGLIIGGIVVIVILFFNSQLAKPARTKIALTSSFALIIILILLFTSSDTRLNPSLIFSNPDLSSGRNEIYNDAYNIVNSDFESGWKYIFLGHGLESRIILFPKSLYTSWESDYIETFISQGLVGFLLTILIYYQLFKRLFRLFSKVKHTAYSRFVFGLIGSGIGFWVISFFSSQLVGRNSSAYFVVIYSLIIIVDRAVQNKSVSPLN